MRTLPPWDANTYFDLPLIKSVGLTQNVASQIITANPNRVGLILGVPHTNSGGVSFSNDPNMTASTGFSISTTVGFMTLTHAEFGPLVATDWYAFPSGLSQSATWVEVVLSRYPVDDPADTADTRDWLHRLTEQIKALVGRKNGNANRPVPNTEQGASQPDYWRRYLGASAIRAGNGKGNTG